MKLIKQKKGAMFLHREIGRGNMPDGRKVCLLQTDKGIHMQVYDKDEKKAAQGAWDTYTLSYEELSQDMFEEIQKLEKHSEEQ